MVDRLPAHVEISGLIRHAESIGGTAAVLRKGDSDRGSILLFISERGKIRACIERQLGLDGYQWQTAGPSQLSDSRELAEFVDRRSRFDPDLWLIELDIADPERFIAELGNKG